MKTPLAALLFVAVLVSARSSDAKPRQAKRFASPDVTRLPVEELIARFQDEPAARLVEDASAVVDPFVVAPPPTGYWAHLSGTPFPRISSTMRELIRRGTAAIPALLDHLTDARPTKLLLRGSAADGPDSIAYLGEDYDSRQPDLNKVAIGLDGTSESGLSHPGEHVKIYRFKVGDLCFAALGQIVNRSLLVWRNWAGIMFGFNPPAHSAVLAAAARADWAGLTDDGFRDFLIHDVEWVDKRGALVTQPRNLAALERLLFYYPTDGVAQAVKLLDRPIIDTSAAYAYWKRLIDTDDEAEQDRLASEFQSQHGHDEYEFVAQWIASMAARPADTVGESSWVLNRKREHENAVKFVNRRLNEAEKNPTFGESQFEFEKRIGIVAALTPYPSAEIDAAVRRLLKRVLALRIEDLPEKEQQCDLALACAEKLLPPGRYKALEQASSSVRRKFYAAMEQKKDLPTYVRACDKFLQKIAADPALQLPAGQP